jgi:RimJ/RimL family protein N-acetyltransferase
MPNLLKVTLGVNTENTAAIALYRSEGFEPFGLERGFMLVDGTLHDELHMARSIASGVAATHARELE